MIAGLSWTKRTGQLFPSRWLPGYPGQSEQDSSFPAVDRRAILNLANRTALSPQIIAGYPKQSEQDSWLPADVRRVILNKANRTEVSQQMIAGLSWINRTGQEFPSRWSPGYPNQSEQNSSFPADDRQAILNKANRTAVSQQMFTGLSILNKANSTRVSQQMIAGLS